MATPPQSLSPTIRFPEFTDYGDLNSLSIVVQDLSLIYDVAAIAVLPDYAQIYMPEFRFGPRRWSPLEARDRLKVRRISLASPLTIAFDLAGLAAAGITVVGNRILVAVKTWQDILAAGLDIQQREQTLSENRELAPIRLRQAQLKNDLLDQQVRRATAEADIVTAARDSILQNRPSADEETSHPTSDRRRRTAASLSSAEFAELLDEPMRRVLGYSGGVLDVAGVDPE